MKIASTALRRTLRRWIVFVLLLAAPLVAAGISGTESVPPAGLYLPEQDPASQRIAEHLQANGFILFADPGDMEELVRMGQLNCGAVFCPDFAGRLEAGDVEGCVQFYRSPSSYTPELYQSHVAAAIFREYVPYISAAAFEGTDVTRQQVMEAYEAMFAEGYVFSFEVLVAEESRGPEDVKTRALVMGAAAIVQCTVVFALCAATMENSFRPLVGRLGLRKAITEVVLPEVLLNILWTWLFGGAGLYLAGYPELVWPFAIYGVLLSGVGLTVASAFRKANRMYVLLPILVICSAALCPIYTDLALLLPAVETVRCCLPVYWLWLIPQRPVLWAAVAEAALAAGFGAVILRSAVLEKYRFWK